jgi:hypothetical protein
MESMVHSLVDIDANAPDFFGAKQISVCSVVHLLLDGATDFYGFSLARVARKLNVRDQKERWRRLRFHVRSFFAGL